MSGTFPHSGAAYTVHKLDSSHGAWTAVAEAVQRRTKSGAGPYGLAELYDVRWRQQPFPATISWTHQVKPNRRFFFHGTALTNVQAILETGFQVRTPNQGAWLLGGGVYAAYHTNKGAGFAPEGYVFSVMVYAPNTHVIHGGEHVDDGRIAQLRAACDALEVRSGAIITANGRAPWTMSNHEICVFDSWRVIPRYLIKLTGHR